MATFLKWASYGIIAASVLVLMRSLPLGDAVGAINGWVSGLGVWGPVVFGAIYVVAVVAMLPASLLTLAAGATFGLAIGTLTVVLASNIGAALALLIGRYLARSKVEQFVAERPKLAAVDGAINEGGWKVVAMLRLSPAVPFNVQNYLYGLTSVPFWTCVLTSVAAMLPGTFMYVYLGHAASSATGAGGGKSPAEWGLLIVGLLATIAVSVYITRLAQQKLHEQTLLGKDDQMQNDSTQPLAGQSLTKDDKHAKAEPQRSSRLGLIGPPLVAGLMLILAGCAYANRQAIPGFFASLLSLGPPKVVMAEEYTENSEGRAFDHSTWDGLLKSHVDADGWVNYNGFRMESGKLDAYLKSIAEVNFIELGRDEKLALLINAYNAFTVKLILDHGPVASIKDISAGERWEAVRWNVGGNVWSLEQIEHEQIRPKFREPRVHFALVCAAAGCPPLRNEAFAADALEQQLSAQANYVMTHKTWVASLAPGRLGVSRIFLWYEGDFTQQGSMLADYIAKYRNDIVSAGRLPAVEPLEYDWTLNDISNRQPR